MIANFALSLSFEGIRLLHRVPEGWNLVGETGLDVPDLTAALTQLRDDALLLEPDGIRTKLIIPSEQIKFVTLETAQTELGDVLAALDGATPYPVDELIVDFDRNGGRTHIAAVARETLAEAEGFANEHKFNPVCFVATPPDFSFQKEVFFGPAISASAPQTERDLVPAVQTGIAILPSTGEADDPNAPPPMFTSRAKPTSAEGAVSSPIVAEPIHDVPEAPADAEISFARTAPAPMAVAIDTPDAPETSPVVPTAGAPAAAKSAPLTAPPRAEEIAETGGFRSRRKSKKSQPKPKKERANKKAAIATKQASPVRSRPRFLGLILTAILLIFMAIVAIWASTLSEEELAGWFGFGSSVTATEDPPVTQVAAAAPQADATDVAANLELVPLDEQADARPIPQVRLTETGRVLSPAEANRIYAATGVWQRAPRFPLEPRSANLILNVPPAFISPRDPADVRLPDLALMQPDLGLLPPVNPPAAGTDFARDADGFVLATPEGARTPSGAIVYSGSPPKKPPLRARAATPQIATNAPPGVIVISGRPTKIPPRRPVFAAPEAPAATEETVATATTAPNAPDARTPRPKLRPTNLVPAVIASADPALANSRPKKRPAGLAPTTLIEPDPEPQAPDITAVVGAIAAAAPVSNFVDVTARAVRRSERPDNRPRNFARVVSRARQLEQQQAEQAAAQSASSAATQPQAASSAPARSSGSVPTTVARAATIDNGIRLRDINLIGVYGRPNDRRALIRLGNGRYVKVQVGSRLDGGRVSAIGDSALNYVKRGKTYALVLPDN